MGHNRLGNRHLPSTNSIVTFSGQMLTFQGHIAIITVDDIAYVATLRDRRPLPYGETFARFGHDIDMEAID